MNLGPKPEGQGIFVPFYLSLEDVEIPQHRDHSD